LVKDIVEQLSLQAYFCVTAGIIGLVFLNRLHSFEKLIVLNVWINISADIIASAFVIKGMTSEMIYNISAPIEQLVTLFIYNNGVNTLKLRNIHFGTMCLIFLLSLSNYFLMKNPYEFHSYTIIFSGLTVAIFSCLQLQFTISRLKPWLSVIFWFSFANVIYYTLMTSTISSLPLAIEVSDSFARSIKAINDIGYILWSILISIGILWNRTRII
jgi:hypothetical protein